MLINIDQLKILFEVNNENVGLTREELCKTLSNLSREEWKELVEELDWDCELCGEIILSLDHEFLIALKCNHTFHFACLEKFRNIKGNQCPICKKGYSPTHDDI